MNLHPSLVKQGFKTHLSRNLLSGHILISPVYIYLLNFLFGSIYIVVLNLKILETQYFPL